MVKSLYENLNEIRKKMRWERNIEIEKRLKRLKEVCSDGDILNNALEIAKNESTLNLPSATLITALTAILLNFISDVQTRYGILVLWIIFICFIAIFEIPSWTKLYYDLIELRRERREELDISRLNIIISKVEAIYPRIDVLEKNIGTQIEAINKEIMSIKRK